MGELARVDRVQIVEDLRISLSAFAPAALQIMEAAAIDIDRTLNWLEETLHHWKGTTKYWQNELDDAESQGEAEEIRRCEYRLEEARENLEIARIQRGKVEEAAGDYRRQAQKLTSVLVTELPRATALISRMADTLQAYLAVGAHRDFGPMPPVSLAPSPGKLGGAEGELNSELPRETVQENRELEIGVSPGKAVEVNIATSGPSRDLAFDSVVNFLGSDELYTRYVEKISDSRALGKQYGLSESEQIALRLYTENAYSDINSVLRGGGFVAPYRVSAAQKLAKTVAAALRKLPDYKGLAVRETILPPQVLENMAPDAIYVAEAFESATYDRENSTFRSQQDSNAVIAFHSQTGKKIDAFASDSEEREILFSPGSRFRVIFHEVDDAGRSVITLAEVKREAASGSVT